MLTDPLQLRATPERIRIAGRAAGLSDAALARAVDIVVRTPPAQEWRRFLSIALALLGAGLLLAGVICFIAFNWSSIGRFGKFALVEAAIVGATLVAWRKLPRATGQVALLAAAVLVGPLLALFGQTYQTGADPYGLFLTWCALIVPWVFVARFSALWVVALTILDVGLTLYGAQILDPESGLYVPLVIAALHAIAVAAWEWQARRPSPWLDERWAVRVGAVVGFAALLVPAIVLILDSTQAGAAGVLGVVGLAAAIIGTLRYHRGPRRDLFMVTLAVVSGMAWVTALAGRVVLVELDLEAFGAFVMTGFVVWEIALGVRWYRRAS